MKLHTEHGFWVNEALSEALQCFTECFAHQKEQHVSRQLQVAYFQNHCVVVMDPDQLCLSTCAHCTSGFRPVCYNHMHIAPHGSYKLA